MKLLLQGLSLLTFVSFQVWAIPASDLGGKKVVCYFGSWAVYRWGSAAITGDDLDPGLCTHFIYTFVGLDPSSASIVSLDPDLDFGASWRKPLLAPLCAKARARGTKCMVAMGGWNEGSSKYSQVVCNPSTRSILIQSIVSFVKNNDLDGFDIDWEYPAQRGGGANDRQCYTAFLQELSPIFKANGWVLSAAVSANKYMIGESYDVPVLSANLDMINVMAYDLHGSWEDVTGHNAPLYASSSDIAAGNEHLSVSAAVRAWLDLGADPSKVVLGLGLYGRSFTLRNPSQHSIGAPAGGLAPSGWIPEAGFYGYNEICANNGTVWTTDWDAVQQVPFAFSGNKWVGYDDTASIRLKGCLANDFNLGGLMVWTVDTDDFRGTCGQGKFPLINAAVSSLRDPSCGSSSNTPSPTQTTQTPTASTTQAPPSPTTAAPLPPTTEAPLPSTTEAPLSSTTDTPPAPTTSSPITEVPTTTAASTGTDTSAATEKTTSSPLPVEDNLIAPQCETLGQRIRDGNDCSVFWFCIYGADEKLQPQKMLCGTGLNYDPTIQGCNFRSLVRC